jgi:WS/DGAT/MGAT family acyltransferase
MQQLSGVDASFLYFDTPKVPGHIFSVYVYDQSTAPKGAVTFKGILSHVEHRLHVSRMFRQKLARVPFDMDHPYWVEDRDFDIEYHIRHIALPRPGDWRQLCIQVARLHSRGLDLSRPLWEWYVIEGLDNVEGVPKGGFAIMQKIHHAAVDGVTLLEITSAVHDHSPEAVPRPQDGAWKPEPEPSPLQLLARAGLNNAVRPMRFARTVARTLPGGFRVQQQLSRRTLQLPSSSPAPRTRFSGAVSGHRVVEARRYRLDDVKAMRTAVEGATVNDVALAIVAGGLREYLSSKGELPAEPLRVMVPISIRTDEQKGTAGNQVSAMVAELATNVADPRQRLAAITASTHQSKAFAQAMDAGSLSAFSEFMPGGLAALAARTAGQFEMATRTNPTVNTVVSNVPGSRTPLYMAGARLVMMFGGAAVADGMGLLHGVTSYCDELVISVVSDRQMMPDPATYADCLERSFEELRTATVGAG